MRTERVIYYQDPLRDDFARTNIRQKPVEGDFPYLHTSWLWRAAAWVLYYVVAMPLVLLVAKTYLGLKFENRGALKELRGKGYYLYGNHTRNLDAFVPALAAFPTRAYIVANADAVSLPCLKHVVLMLGGVPIPTSFSGMKGFWRAVRTRCAQGSCVAIYPEAHVWPFYTGIRPFPDTSFRYPATDGGPVVAMVTTYRRRRGLFRLCKRPGMTVTFSKPIYPEPGQSVKEAKAQLRDEVYQFMCKVAVSKENIPYIRYEQLGEETPLSGPGEQK